MPVGHVPVILRVTDIDLFHASGRATREARRDTVYRASDATLRVTRPDGTEGREKDTGDFMRCGGSQDHHTLFLAHRMDRAGFNHAAFEVKDFDEIMFGGKYMAAHGWPTRAKPGRHIMGSNLFWYFQNPGGGAVEYFADMDRLDDNWEPRIWDENLGYAMWMLDEA
jgi:hypothetical protein